MALAHERDLVGVVATSTAERLLVVELETAPLGAASTGLAHESALVPVAQAHDASHRGRHVARLRRGIRLLQVFSRRLRFGETLRFEPFELLRHRRLDDRRQVGVHEVLEPLQLLPKLPARRELDFVPRWRKGLDHGPKGRRRRKQRTRLLRGQNRDSVRTEFPPLHRRRSRNITSRALGQLSHHGRHVGPGRELGQKLLNLTFAPVRGSGEEGPVVLLRQVRSELSNARQMKATVAQHFQKERIPP